MFSLSLSEMGMQEGGSSLHHTNVPLPKRSQPWCLSLLSFYLSLAEIREFSLSFVAFGFLHQGLDSLPPSLAAFCPWEHGVLVYVGFGMQKEALFYSLRKKQVPVPCHGQWGLAVLPCVLPSVTGVGWAQGTDFILGTLESGPGEQQSPAPASGCIQAGSQSVPDPTGGKVAAPRSISPLSPGCLGQLSELSTLSLPITLLRAVQLWALPSPSELSVFLLLGCRCSGRSPCQPLPRPSACPQPHLSWPSASVVSAGGAWAPPSSARGETSVLIPRNKRHVLKPGSYSLGQGETSRRLLGQK